MKNHTFLNLFLVKTQLLSILFMLIAVFVISCKKDQICGEYECQNGGECIDDECRCSVGYEGEYCEFERIPHTMQISNITVTNLPDWTSSNNIFTSDPEPDIYMMLFVNGTLVYGHPTHYTDALQGEKYKFKPANAIALLYPTMDYTMLLMDKDDDPDDLVSQASFIPYEPNLGFPKKIKVENSDGFTFEMEVLYGF